MEFSQEFNGYNKTEVDMYINRVSAGYEAKLMEERLKRLEAERQVLSMRNEQIELKHKEKNIMEAIDVIEKANKFQEEGASIYSLVIEKLQILVETLEAKFPQLKNDPEFAELLTEFKSVLGSKNKVIAQTDIRDPINTPNDSMRILLTKMSAYRKKQDPPKEVKINTTRQEKVAPKEVTQNLDSFEEIKLPQNPFMNHSALKVDNEYKIFPEEPKNSNFNFEEALNPKEDLAEIMKAFNFYDDNKKSS